MLAARHGFDGVNPVLPSINEAVTASDSYQSTVPNIADSVVTAEDENWLVAGEYVDVAAEPLYDLAEQYADEYVDGCIDLPAWDEDFIPVYLPRDAAVQDRADFLGFGNVVNACFWRIREDEASGRVTEAYSNMYDGVEWTGAMGYWAGLKTLWETEIRDSDQLFADWFEDVTAEDLEQYWGDIPLKGDRVAVLRDTAETLRTRYADGADGASFATVIDEADGNLYDRGDGVVDRLAQEFNGYQDFRVHDGQVIWLEKQAQLCGNMWYLHFMEDETMDVTGAEDLEVFANYRLPQTLHNEDVLRYKEPLPSIIDGNELISSGSQMEWELRMLTVAGGRLLLNTVNDLLPEHRELTIPELDNALYQTGRDLPRDTEKDGADVVRGHPKVVTLDF